MGVSHHNWVTFCATDCDKVHSLSDDNFIVRHVFSYKTIINLVWGHNAPGNLRDIILFQHEKPNAEQGDNASILDVIPLFVTLCNTVR
jgi:hypothetical protein